MPETTLTARSVWVTLLLIVPLVCWVEYTEVVAAGPDLATTSLPMASVSVLLVLLAVNGLLKRFVPARAFTRAELLFIYLLTTVSLSVTSVGMMQFLTPNLVGWFKFATPENGWAQWHPLVPRWAVPDPAVIPAYFDGQANFFDPAILRGWALPIAVWTAFILTLLFCMFCIVSLLRKQWVERERLAFPIVQILLEITAETQPPLWRNPLLWVGVGIPVILESLAAVHFALAPAVPYVPIKPEGSLDLRQFFPESPWNAIGYTTLAFYPLVIGLTYLLSLEVSFSCWFFYLFTKVQSVAGDAFGWSDGASASAFPYVQEQGWGAYLGLGAATLFFARRHLAAAFRQAFLNDPADDAGEALSYRAAYVGFFVSAASLVGFGVALGLSWGTALVFFALFLLAALAFTRIRAEAGLPWGFGPWLMGHEAMVALGGTSLFRPSELTAFAFIRWFDVDWRCLSQPAQLETLKAADAVHLANRDRRRLPLLLVAVILVGTLAAWGACLGY